MRVCLYTRISTDEEHQPTSLHTQRERLERSARRRRAGGSSPHHEDQATGTKLDRPGLQARARPRAREAIDLLLVYRVDRSLARCVSSRGWPRNSTSSTSS